MSCDKLCNYSHIPLYCPRNKWKRKEKSKLNPKVQVYYDIRLICNKYILYNIILNLSICYMIVLCNCNSHIWYYTNSNPKFQIRK